MSAYITGSDGNIYLEPWGLSMTGSLYKTQYIVSTEDDIDDPDDDGLREPGILFDTELKGYWADVATSRAQVLSGSVFVDTYDESTHQGCVWVYDLTDSQKSTIESDSDWIATYVTSSL